MKQIKIGTCVPGTKAEEWLKGFVGKGFETFSSNFHMSLEGTDLDKLALTTDKLLACLLYTSPSPRDAHESRMPSSA